MKKAILSAFLILAIFIVLKAESLVAVQNGGNATLYAELQVSATTTDALPILTTAALTSITSISVNSGGNITSDGGAAVTARGVCWSTNENPTIADYNTFDGTGTGSFSSSISGLSPGETYYFRAYAINSVGTAYGNQLSTTTPTALAVVVTYSVSSIKATTASSGGNITSDGGSSVTARGVCWSTSSSPTTADNKTSNGTGTGSYVSNLTGLIENTTYYLRAYATNTLGTAYGSELVFKTTVADRDGNLYHTVNIGTQVWMVENLLTTKYNDGTSIPNVTTNAAWSALTTPGYCWYNNNSSNKFTYGALYNWYTVNTGKLCPTGWHVPTDADWTVLTTFLGGESVAGSKLKEAGTAHWLTPNTGATNETGFSGLPGGSRTVTGTFGLLGSQGYWWSSTLNSTNAYLRPLTYDGTNMSQSSDAKGVGYSVRCLQGEYPIPTLLSVNVFLEGPYSTGTGLMNKTLNTSLVIPLAQPYNTAPWNYPGTETLSSVPVDAVDWVLIELRQAVSPYLATSSTILAKRAAILKSNGTVVDLDGTNPVLFENSSITEGNNLYIVVRHRNHLAIMSATGAILTDGVYSYDFTTSIGQAYGGGSGYKQVGAKFAMVSGDVDVDGNIFVSDFNTWAVGFGAVNSYLKADIDMDGSTFVSDYNKWAINFGSTVDTKFKSAQIEKNQIKSKYSSMVPE